MAIRAYVDYQAASRVFSGEISAAKSVMPPFVVQKSPHIVQVFRIKLVLKLVRAVSAKAWYNGTLPIGSDIARRTSRLIRSRSSPDKSSIRVSAFSLSAVRTFSISSSIAAISDEVPIAALTFVPGPFPMPKHSASAVYY